MVLYWCSRYAVIVKICSYITPLQRTKSSCLKSHICKDFFMPLPCVAQLYHRIKNMCSTDVCRRVHMQDCVLTVEDQFHT